MGGPSTQLESEGTEAEEVGRIKTKDEMIDSTSWKETASLTYVPMIARSKPGSSYGPSGKSSPE
jgi:hypothetical protein